MMMNYPHATARLLFGLFFCTAPITCALAGVPNAIRTPLSLDYKDNNVDLKKEKEAEATKSPDLFGPSTGPLPFFGEEIRKRGYELPDPYGIGYNHMNMRQNIKVNSIDFSGLKIFGFPLPQNIFKINVGHTRERSLTDTAKLDTWLFPFLNVYAVVGHTRGSSNSTVSVDAPVIGKMSDIDFILKFKGTTYGAGTTLAYGYHNWFGTMDFNYTRTNFDILDGNTTAYTFTPRVGYRFTVPGSSKYSIPVSHASLWVGSMYQDVSQDFGGNLNNLHMPANLVSLVNFVNKDKEGRFRVKQHLQSPWNILVGGQYELTRNFNVITEVGFEKRNSIMVGGEFRF